MIKPKQFPSFHQGRVFIPWGEVRGWKESFTPSMNLIPRRDRPRWSRGTLHGTTADPFRVRAMVRNKVPCL